MNRAIITILLRQCIESETRITGGFLMHHSVFGSIVMKGLDALNVVLNCFQWKITDRGV